MPYTVVLVLQRDKIGLGRCVYGPVDRDLSDQKYQPFPMIRDILPLHIPRLLLDVLPSQQTGNQTLR